MWMPCKLSDGGRNASGYHDAENDCVARALAIVTQRPYGEIHLRLQAGLDTWQAKHLNLTRKPGVNAGHKWFKDYLKHELGMTWHPLLGLRSIRLSVYRPFPVDELPRWGRFAVNCSSHWIALIDGTAYDIYPVRRNTATVGYWSI